MDLSGYKHNICSRSPNKNLIPKNVMTFEQLDEFNAIYKWAKENFLRVEPTPSGGMPNNRKVKKKSRFFVSSANNKFEMVICCSLGEYRFLLQPAKPKDNSVSGQKACRAFYRLAEEMGIDISKYECSSDMGLKIKSQIESPHIELLFLGALKQVIPHMHHIDFRSSYASRIIEEYPEMEPLYRKIYELRKDDDGFYKHVMTNSIGAFQSKYCVNFHNRRSVKPYAFAKLSKIAINGTRRKVETMIHRLSAWGAVPVFTNTDGIWYYSKRGPYHGEGEGKDLKQWYNDHVECRMLISSVGAYQFVEGGVCHTVLRGISSLDKIKPDRSTWEFGDILKAQTQFKYVFDDNEGVKLIYG